MSKIKANGETIWKIFQATKTDLKMIQPQDFGGSMMDI